MSQAAKRIATTRSRMRTATAACQRTARVIVVTVAALRRYVVAHQGYASRFRRARIDDVAAAIRRLRRCNSTRSRPSTARTGSRSPSRIGAYPSLTLSRLLLEGRSFEYWAHEACLLPIEDYRLFKRRMLMPKRPPWWGRQRTAERRKVEC